MKNVLRVIIAILVIGILVSGYNYKKSKNEYIKAEKIYKIISDIAKIENTSIKENVESPKVSDINFKELQKINPDIKAWLILRDTPINYPILISTNNDYYLYKLPTREYSSSGSIFVDSRNKDKDNHFLIYGHNMKNGTMFAKLLNYSSQEFYQSHPEFLLITEGKEYKLKVISAYYTNDDDYTYKIGVNFEEYLNYIRNKSIIVPQIKADKRDKVITFSTCAYLKTANRFVVHCIVKEK